MILMYHNIAPITPTEWWVSADSFNRQLCELRAYQVVSLDEYDAENPLHCVITFNDGYKNILQFAAPLLKKFGYPFELFITSDVIGKSNECDVESGEPEVIFADEDELRALVALGGRLQWHTRSHPHLPHVTSRSQLEAELTVPDQILSLDPKGFRWFAYPHGEFTDEVKELARGKFAGALSCVQGSDSDAYALNRIKVVNAASFKKASLGIIIPSYKYGHFLPEAIESALRQTRPVDKILIADDCSPDATPEVGRFYAEKFPGLIVYRRNEKNLGIVQNFNQAVAALGTDYVCFLGADNRFRSDFIERTSAILDTHDRCAVAYTDYAMFGPLASLEYDQVPADRKGPVVEGTYFIVNFPDLSRQGLASLRKGNFIHGSSLFRRAAFERVGGYLDTAQAEDHNLFLRIVEAGWEAERAAAPLLEYRKHSLDQANARLISQAELNFYKDLVRAKDKRIAELSALVQGRASVLAAVTECIRSVARRLFSALPQPAQSKLKVLSRKILVACERCEHPIFKLRFLIPSGVRRRIGRMIWSVQKQYCP